MENAVRGFFFPPKESCKSASGHILCNGFVANKSEIHSQSPFLVISGDFLKYLRTKDLPLSVPIPSNNKQSGELDYKLMLITINAQDHFFAVLCITDDYWYAYDGLASEPAVRTLNLPEDVNGSITLVAYLCFSLLITMASQSKISKHKLSEPNNAEKQVKQTKLCHSASKVEEKK